MKVFALGSNESGQLGIGHSKDVSTPSAIEFAPFDPTPFRLGYATEEYTPSSAQTPPPNEPIVSIKSGKDHTILLTASGKVLTTGSNRNGQCGFKRILSEFNSFTPVDFFKEKDIRFIAATGETSYFVSAEGHVFVCGDDRKGRRGIDTRRHGRHEDPVQIPDFPPSGTNVVDIDAGEDHVVTVLSDGEVYGWGDGSRGQLGDPAGAVWRPKRLDDVPFAAHRVVCGKDFTCVFGDPAEGKLHIVGLRKRDKFGIRSGLPDTLRGWIDVQATDHGICVLMEDHRLVAWGRNDHGQLPPSDVPVVAMTAGSEHVLTLADTGEVLAWGWEKNDGEPDHEHGDVKDRCKKLEIEGQVLQIAAGHTTSWIVTA